LVEGFVGGRAQNCSYFSFGHPPHMEEPSELSVLVEDSLGCSLELCRRLLTKLLAIPQPGFKFLDVFFTTSTRASWWMLNGADTTSVVQGHTLIVPDPSEILRPLLRSVSYNVPSVVGQSGSHHIVDVLTHIALETKVNWKENKA
jgi:hypothetical protein